MWIDGASNHVALHDLLMWANHVIFFVPFLLVNGVIVYFVIKYRRRGPNDVTSRIAHSTKIEVIWTVVPTIVLIIIGFFGIYGFVEMRAAPANSMVIKVTGAKWNWTFTYPEGTVGNDKPLKSSILYLPENRDIKLVMKSTDVIHSFFVPAFRVKEDVVGSIYTYIYFKPEISTAQMAMSDAERKLIKEVGYPGHPDPGEGCYDLRQQNEALKNAKDKNPGDAILAKKQPLDLKRCAAYRVYCTEYCGQDHSVMLNWAVVLPQGDFDNAMTWLKAEADNITKERGETIFKQKCMSCHTTDGSAGQGPTFKGLWGKAREFESGESISAANENYITESINNPAVKIVKGFTGVKMTPQNLSDSEIGSIIKFMQSL